MGVFELSSGIGDSELRPKTMTQRRGLSWSRARATSHTQHRAQKSHTGKLKINLVHYCKCEIYKKVYLCESSSYELISHVPSILTKPESDNPKDRNKLKF